MLRQILPKIGAVIRTEGAVKVDSLPCMTEYEAQESVSEQAICYFIAKMNICINDLTYPAFKETYKRLNHYMSWSQLVETRYDMLRVQMDNLLKSHKDLLDRLGSICSSYGDILSLATPPASIGAEPSPGPDLRYIQLVEQLFSLVLENTPTYIPFGSL
jgi:hypothetical protein